MTGSGYGSLLRFSSASLEARFWASARVRSGLLRTDRAGVVVVIANNCMLAHTLATMGADSALLMQVGFLAIILSAQLAALRCAATGRHDAALPCQQLAAAADMLAAAAEPRAAAATTA
jgi:hypothetical protein